MGTAFTYDRYRDLLRRLDEEWGQFRSYDEDLRPGDVLLRHDIDLSPERAERVARIEAELGVHATYFVLFSSALYDPLHDPVAATLDEIEALGHDIGLHFSTHRYWDAEPSTAALRDRIAAERAALATVVDPVDVVAFHRPPEWTLGRTFEGLATTYEPRFFDEVEYRSDSRQRWREETPLPDDPTRLQALTHPGLWGETDALFDERVRAAVDEARQRVGEYARSEYGVGGTSP